MQNYRNRKTILTLQTSKNNSTWQSQDWNFFELEKKKDKIIALVQWFLVSEKPDVVGRIMDPTDVHVLISRPCKYVPLQGDIKIADEIKVAKQLTL